LQGLDHSNVIKLFHAEWRKFQVKKDKTNLKKKK
jgi:hypothetical protein